MADQLPGRGAPESPAERLGAQGPDFGKPNADGSAVARARASVADLKLGGGALELQGVVGQVNIFQGKSGKVVRRTLEGTHIGAIVANGQTREVPAPGELLDGSGLVLNVGTAKARINR